MGRHHAHFQYKEPLLERTLRRLRLQKIVQHIPDHARVLDLGCGYDYYLLRLIAQRIDYGIAMDLSVQPSHDEKIKTIEHDLNTLLPLPSNDVDVVVLMANMEHLSKPLVLLHEAYRVSKPGGLVIITTPSVYAKPLLEFLAYRLHVVSEPEIRDHKMYFNRGILRDYLQQAGFSNIHHRYFQFYMNNFVLATK